MRVIVLFTAMRTLVRKHSSILRRIKIIVLLALQFIVAISLLQLRLRYRMN